MFISTFFPSHVVVANVAEEINLALVGWWPFSVAITGRIWVCWPLPEVLISKAHIGRLRLGSVGVHVGVVGVSVEWWSDQVCLTDRLMCGSRRECVGEWVEEMGGLVPAPD